jgi:hypothetical protein
MLMHADCFFDEPAHLVISDWGHLTKSEGRSRRYSAFCRSWWSLVMARVYFV